MWPVPVAPLDRFIRDEPGVAAAAHARRARAPPADIGLILVGHAEREPIEACGSTRREVKDELVAVVDEPIAVDRLVMADRQIAREAGGRAGRLVIDRDGLYPVNDVLHPQMGADSLRNVERRPWIARFGPHIEEKRAVRPQHTGRGGHPSVRPLEVLRR